MKEIKFRVEDTESNKFIATEEIENGNWKTWYNDGEAHLSRKEFEGIVKSKHKIRRRQYTCFCDNFCREIYDGDIISDWTEVDGQMKQSFKQVFWNEKYGAWHLDDSYNQDKSSSTDLWLELHDFEYKVTGDVYKTPELLLP